MPVGAGYVCSLALHEVTVFTPGRDVPGINMLVII